MSVRRPGGAAMARVTMSERISRHVVDLAAAFLVIVAIVIAALIASSPNPEHDPMDDAVTTWWEHLPVDEQSGVCVALTDWQWTGFRLIAEQSDQSGILDLGPGGRHDDNHETRKAIGSALDRLAQQVC